MSQPMSDARRLRLAKGLRGMIPSGFPCKVGCFACCKQPVTMLKPEYEELQKISPRQDVETHPSGVTVTVQDKRGWCPWINGETGMCTIYNDRPTVCRTYGQHVTSPCREGVECPPELVVPEPVIEKVSVLGGSDAFIKLSKTERQAYYKALVTWRERMKLPLDAGPSADDPVHRETFTEEFHRALVWLKAQEGLDKKNSGAV